MLEKLWKWLVAICVFLGSAGPTHAQPAADLDKMLEWQDDMVLRSFQQAYPQDFRYQSLLSRISSRLNGHLGKVYANPHKQVRYYVFVGRMGFNAQSWHRIIVFDTLLLDALSRLAGGIVAHGGLESAFTQQLAITVAQLNTGCQQGFVVPNLANPENPYGLPSLPELTPAQRERSEALFEEMLAGWVAHESSHTFLDHCRDRVEEARLAALYRQGRVGADAAGQYIHRVQSYSLSLQKEREADRKGVSLLLEAGYTTQGLVYSLEFARYLEELSGIGSDYFRTHPTPTERIQVVREVEAQRR